LDYTFLHESEDQLRKEDLLMALEETAGDPLVDCDSDHQNKKRDSLFNVLLLLSLVDSLEEEVLEGLERVLVHVVNDPKLDEEEVEHGTLGGDLTVSLSGDVNLFLGLLGNLLLLLNLH